MQQLSRWSKCCKAQKREQEKREQTNNRAIYKHASGCQLLRAAQRHSGDAVSGRSSWQLSWAVSSLLLPPLLQDALVPRRNQPVPLILVGGLGLAVEGMLHSALHVAAARQRGETTRGELAMRQEPLLAFTSLRLHNQQVTAPAARPWRPQTR